MFRYAKFVILLIAAAALLNHFGNSGGLTHAIDGWTHSSSVAGQPARSAGDARASVAQDSRGSRAAAADDSKFLGIFPISNANAESAPTAAIPAGAQVTIGFSPGNAEDTVVRAIDGARRSILVAAYSFTSRPISTALLNARDRGVEVRIVADKSQRTERYTSVRFLANKGIPVRINDRYAIMHNKFLVIDGQTVETGSFNFTRSAAMRNAENVIVLQGVPQVAAIYAREWTRLWNEAAPL